MLPGLLCAPFVFACALLLNFPRYPNGYASTGISTAATNAENGKCATVRSARLIEEKASSKNRPFSQKPICQPSQQYSR